MALAGLSSLRRWRRAAAGEGAKACCGLGAAVRPSRPLLLPPSEPGKALSRLLSLTGGSRPQAAGGGAGADERGWAGQAPSLPFPSLPSPTPPHCASEHGGGGGGGNHNGGGGVSE